MQKIKRAKTLTSFSDLKVSSNNFNTKDIEYKEGLSLFEKANLAYKNNLFVSGWYNQSTLSLLIHNSDNHLSPSLQEKYHISLLVDNQQVVACGIIDKEELTISIFVKSDCRGKNYGSKIINKTLAETNLTTDDIYAQHGVKGSSVFYNKNNIVTFISPRNFEYFRKRSLLHIYGDITLRKEYIKKDILNHQKHQQNTPVKNILSHIKSSNIAFQPINENYVQLQEDTKTQSTSSKRKP